MQTAGIGGDTDSTYEMLYKSGEVFDDDEYRAWFTDALSSIRSKLRVEGADYLHYGDACDDASPCARADALAQWMWSLPLV